MLKEALKLRDAGLSVIPVSKDKTPLIKWKEFQTRLPSYDEIAKWWTDYPDANIGVATGVVSNLCVIDIDTDEGKQIIEEYIPEGLVTPMVSTPKGGVHYWFSCDDPKWENNTRALPGIDFRANGGYVVVPPSMNGTGKKYEWLVSMGVGLAPIPDKYIAKISTKDLDLISLKELKGLNSFSMSEGARNEVLFHLVYSTLKGGASYSFAKGLAMEIGLQHGLPVDEINKIFDSAYQRVGRGNRNIAQEVKEWVKLVTSGDFSVTEAYKDLEIVTKEDKANTRKCLTRLVEAKEIVPNGKGRYRTVSDDLEFIDIFSKDIPSFPLQLPLEISSIYEAQQGNVIIVSGEKNTGKTAFCLKTMELNHEKTPVRYMSSEMSEGEFKMRIRKFTRGVGSWKWKNIELLNRTENFADLIKDDGKIYIIDFLEIYEDFYKVGALIRDIWKALNHKGLAIICLQKNPGSLHGRGGSFSAEKARLVINLEATYEGTGNICKLVNVKNWAEGLQTSPDGMICTYKLVQGNEFSFAASEEAYWHHPAPECKPGKNVVRVTSCG